MCVCVCVLLIFTKDSVAPSSALLPLPPGYIWGSSIPRPTKASHAAFLTHVSNDHPPCLPSPPPTPSPRRRGQAREVSAPAPLNKRRQGFPQPQRQKTNFPPLPATRQGGLFCTSGRALLFTHPAAPSSSQKLRLLPGAAHSHDHH